MSIRKIIEGVSKKKTNEMYEDYGFVLEWDELGEELQNEKIVDYAKYNRSEYPGAVDMTDDDILSKDDWYKDIVYSLEAHFPMYF